VEQPDIAYVGGEPIDVAEVTTVALANDDAVDPQQDRRRSERAVRRVGVTG
jgi:hypothetical protein